MNRRAQAAAAVMLLAWGDGARAGQSAADLVAKVVAAQQTRGFTMRARLVIAPPAPGKSRSIQIRAVGQRNGETSRVLYQALWPDAVKGHAVVVEKPRPQVTRGFVFTPPETVTPLTPEMLQEPFLGSDLALEDLSEDFWHWPDPTFAGDDRVGGEPCRVVELRAPAGLETAYALVRSCVSVKKTLPLRIEKVRKDGQVVRRFTVKKMLKRDEGVWVPVIVLVEDPVRKGTTTIHMSRGERGLTISPVEFSIDRIKRLGRLP